MTPGLNPEYALLLVWITFTVIMLTVIASVLVWAARSGQFGDQERARWLALNAMPSPSPAEGVAQPPSASLAPPHSQPKATAPHTERTDGPHVSH